MKSTVRSRAISLRWAKSSVSARASRAADGSSITRNGASRKSARRQGEALPLAARQVDPALEQPAEHLVPPLGERRRPRPAAPASAAAAAMAASSPIRSKSPRATLSRAESWNRARSWNTTAADRRRRAGSTGGQIEVVPREPALGRAGRSRAGSSPASSCPSRSRRRAPPSRLGRARGRRRRGPAGRTPGSRSAGARPATGRTAGAARRSDRGPSRSAWAERVERLDVVDEEGGLVEDAGAGDEDPEPLAEEQEGEQRRPRARQADAAFLDGPEEDQQRQQHHRGGADGGDDAEPATGAGELPHLSTRASYSSS